MDQPIACIYRSEKPRWIEKKDNYVKSLAIGYFMDEDDINRMWEIYQSRVRFIIYPNRGEKHDAYFDRVVEIFYVVAIKSLNLYILSEETVNIELWFSDYMESKFYDDINEGIWFDVPESIGHIN